MAVPLQLDLLNIALALSVLTYYAGVLVMGLPVPARGLKRVGARLVMDSFVSAVLIFSVSLIFRLVDAVLELVGANPAEALQALVAKLYEYSGVYALIKVLGSVLSPFTLKLSSAVASAATSMLAILFSTVNLLVVFYTMVFMARDVLVSLGLVLYSLPLRIGRSAGAALIAFTVVGSVLIPLFPPWMEMMSSIVAPPGLTQRAMEGEDVYLALCVEGDYGSPSAAVIRLRSSAGDEYSLVTLANGCAVVARPYGGVRPGVYEVDVGYVGVKLRAEPSVLVVPDDLRELPIRGVVDYYGTIKAEGAAFPAPGLVVSYSGCRLEPQGVIRAGSSYTLLCRVERWPVAVLVGHVRACSVNVTVEGAHDYAINVYDDSWYGIDVRVVSIYIPGGEDSLAFSVDVEGDCDGVQPQLEAQAPPSLERLLSQAMVTDVLFILTWYFVYNMVGVLSFISLLIMLTYGLARALGGSYVRFPFPV